MRRLLYFSICLLLISRSAVSVPSCGAVVNDIAPCLSYLEGKDATPQCCSGIKDLKAIAKTRADRIAACNCAKQVLSKVKYDPELLPLLPKKCGIDVTLPPIDKNYDCSKVQPEGMM